MIINTDKMPPIDNYTISINNTITIDEVISMSNYSQSVSERVYTVSVTTNNIVGSSMKTSVDICEWLQYINFQAFNSHY